MEDSLFGKPSTSLGFGLLRLCTEGRPSEEAATELIHFALDQGIRILDTADSYCLDDKDFHYGERLARTAVSSWNGPREVVRIITKVGMVRPKGRWVPEGSPKHILKSVLRSLESLETESIFLLQLHVRDPRIPFEETLHALAELKSKGLVQNIGLCNVDLAELEQASRHFPVACVQNELSVVSRSSAEEGTLEWCRRREIPFLAYRPLGGYAKVEKLETNRALSPHAKRLQRPATELALQFLKESGDQVIPLIGARRKESLHASIRAYEGNLDSETRASLLAKISWSPSAKALEQLEPSVPMTALPPISQSSEPSDSPEIVLLMGVQGAGKSSLVRKYTDLGYARLNRDLQGGKLEDLVDELDRLLDEGEQRVVLDNTYPTMSSRWSLIRKAHRYGIPVRCRHIATPLVQAYINVCIRMLERYKRLLGPDEMKTLSKSDPNLPPPVAMQRWMESFEAPSLAEGFSAVDSIPFVRKLDPQNVNKGLLLDVDGTLRKTKSGELYPRSADDVEILPNRASVLKRWMDDGYDLFFVSNQSGVSSGKLSMEDADGAFQRTVELLTAEEKDLVVKEVAYCPHTAFPAGCFCRKPLPGLGIYLMQKHLLDPSQWVMVGDMASDAEFAKNIGAKYFDAASFFV